MHPSIKQAYETGTHPLAKHPIHGVYGKELAFDQYQHIKDLYSKATGSDRMNFQELSRLLTTIINLEARHKEQLEQLAKKLVAQLWKTDVNIFKEAELGSGGESSIEDEDENEELTPEQLKEVHKRITLNTLTHGAAIHQMTTLHHMVKDSIDKLDAKLIPLYDKLSRGAVYSSWFMSIENILQNMGMKGGESHVEWEDDTPQIVASGLIFPMLVHELSKGVMELLTSHGLPKDQETLEKVFKAADRYDTEIFHFFVGPSLWRKFIKLVKPDDLPRVIAVLSKQNPDNLHKIISTVVENPEEARDMLKDFIMKPKEFKVDDIEETIKHIAELVPEDVNESVAEPETEPKTDPKTKPDEEDEDEDFDPFKPPKPGVTPKPKARK